MFGVFSSCGSRLSSFHERQQSISVALRYTLHGALLKAKRKKLPFYLLLSFSQAAEWPSEQVLPTAQPQSDLLLL